MVKIDALVGSGLGGTGIGGNDVVVLRGGINKPVAK